MARKLNVEIANWKEIYTLPREATHDSCSRIFKYKIFNNILYLNKHFNQFKTVSKHLCSLLMKQFFICLENWPQTIKPWKTTQQLSMTVGLVLLDLDTKDSMLGFFCYKGTSYL